MAPPGRTSYRPALPTRGTPGGWRDWWEDPDDHASLREQLAAFDAQTDAVAAAWRTEQHRERWRQARQEHAVATLRSDQERKAP